MEKAELQGLILLSWRWGPGRSCAWAGICSVMRTDDSP